MSYTEYLRRSQINTPKVIDTQMRLPDASSFTWRVKMGAGRISRPTDHVITNGDEPSVTPNFHTKKVMVYAGTGQGGRVRDASDWILSSSVSGIVHDSFTGGKIQVECGNVKSPASQIVGESGNADGNKLGLNMGYVKEDCCTIFRPQSKTYFVDTIPEIKTHKIGIQPASAWNGAVGTMYGTQNAIVCSNTSGAAKLSSGLLVPKDENTLNLHPAGPLKLDFVTAITGPQVSLNGAYGRAPKVGDALRKIPYVERHHGRAWGPRPYPSARVPPSGAPAQLKINDANHYKIK
jgi:hypothetical protein